MKRRVLVLAVVTFVTIAPVAVSALGLQTIVPQDYGCNRTGGCQSICALAELAQNILDDGIFVAIFLSAVLFAWAGWQMVVGGDNSTKRNEAKRTIWYVVIGLVLIVSAWLIVSVIMAALTNNPNWNSLCGS